MIAWAFSVNFARIGRRTIVWGIVCLGTSATCCSTSSAIMRCLSIVGDIMFLDKIGDEDWVKFIVSRFANCGRKFKPVARLITQKVDCHPYYVQQLSQLAWLRTKIVMLPS